MEILDLFRNEIDKIGAKACFVTVDHLRELEAEYKDLEKQKLIGQDMYNRYLDNYYDFSAIYCNPEIKSICITATPSPVNIIKFEFDQSSINVEVPPICCDRKNILNDIKTITKDLFPRYGYMAMPVCLPKKMLAVHGGLGYYGRNNLVYVEGMGSYHRLTAFASDIPCDSVEWHPLRRMDSCEKCSICIKNCPGEAIRENNEIINADRCLTNYNEHSDIFPDWIEKSWHHTLVGCMRCQSVCPKNKDKKDFKKYIVTFSSDETKLILSKTSFENLPSQLQDKLKECCMDIYYHTLARNLEVLLNNNNDIEVYSKI